MAEVLTYTRTAPDAAITRAEFFRADDGTPWVRLIYRLVKDDNGVVTQETASVSKSLAQAVTDGALTAAQKNAMGAGILALVGHYNRWKP